MKVIISKSNQEKVVGMHYYGPGADEAIAGYAVAMKLGLTKKDLDSSIGIHPSTTEDLFNLEVTKRSGEEYRKTEC
jgi:pyruvate/2-oxoglutarate dehydrogenase complex dihydrolipoamide dehydrogenase (E3) component